MEFIVVGFRFRGESPEVLKTGMITLQPEPDNEVDPNAIKVFVGNKHVGYVCKDHTTIIKSVIDTGIEFGIKAESFYPASVKCLITPMLYLDLASV